jgi:hypothetical protein
MKILRLTPFVLSPAPFVRTPIPDPSLRRRASCFAVFWSVGYYPAGVRGVGPPGAMFVMSTEDWWGGTWYRVSATSFHIRILCAHKHVVSLINIVVDTNHIHMAFKCTRTLLTLLSRALVLICHANQSHVHLPLTFLANVSTLFDHPATAASAANAGTCSIS